MSEGTKDTPVVATESLPAATGAPTNMIELLAQAVEKGVDVEMLERLVALKERTDAAEAARQFASDLAAFQADCPPIVKNRRVEFTTKDGRRVDYAYAELHHIATTVREKLNGRGFSYTWDTTFDAGMITCVCTLRHRNGHSESSRFACPIEANKMRSSAQNAKASVTFAERVSLIQVLGITDSEDDTDAQPMEDAEPETITDAQVGQIERAIESAGAKLDKSLKWASNAAGRPIESLDALPANLFAPLMEGLTGERQ